jgi:hypothetical protein
VGIKSTKLISTAKHGWEADVERDAAREQVVAHLARVVAPHYRKSPITDDTEVYYDLRLYGDDLYAFLVWLGQKFGTDFHINLPEYAPSERIFPFWFRQRRERREREGRPYKSLKVRDILAAIEAGRWPTD